MKLVARYQGLAWVLLSKALTHRAAAETWVSYVSQGTLNQSLSCSWRNPVLCDPAALYESEMEKAAAMFGEPPCDDLSDAQTVS